MNNQSILPVNEEKVIDRVIDVYLCMCPDLNTEEVLLLGQKLINLANRRATDVELAYKDRNWPGDQYPTVDQIMLENPEVDFSHWKEA